MKFYSFLLTAFVLFTGAQARAENLKITSGGTLSTHGTAGGPNLAHTRQKEDANGQMCTGLIPIKANHTLKVLKYGVYGVKLKKTPGLSLVVVGPKETLCGKGSVTLSAPGTYQIYVGSEDATPINYELTIIDSAG